jgi:hypothetical protein
MFALGDQLFHLAQQMSDSGLVIKWRERNL